MLAVLQGWQPECAGASALPRVKSRLDRLMAPAKFASTSSTASSRRRHDIVSTGCFERSIRRRQPIGIGRTFQHNALFRRLSVRENVLPVFRHGTASFSKTSSGWQGQRRARGFLARAERTMAFLGLTAMGRIVSHFLTVCERVDLARTGRRPCCCCSTNLWP